MYVSSVTYCMYVMPSSRRTLQRFQSFWTMSWVFMPRDAAGYHPTAADESGRAALRGFLSSTAWA
jgi:hypothetical protein